MARIVVFDLQNQAVVEFSAICNRGWILLGNTGVSDGGQTSVPVPDDVAGQPWLQLGSMVLIEQPPLPAWAGVIDVPWTAKMPVQISLYNAEYLFSMRSAERSVAVSGPLSATVEQMIRLANEQEQTPIRLGDTGGLSDAFDRVVEQANIWDQMIRLLEDAGYEMVLRPQRDAQRRLAIYADVGVGLGVNTGFLLHDGERGNMAILDATVNGKVTNRVKGVSGKSTEDGQLESDIQEDQDSQNSYRTRSEVVQYQNVTQLAVINQYAKAYLDLNSKPYLDLTVDAQEETFPYLRVGNVLQVHASSIHLPGGRHGWRGYSRILAMVYDETRNTVKMTLRGAL